MPFPLPAGSKLYFPNIIFRLVRSPQFPPHQAVFKVPPQLSKLDIKEYLTKLYNITITDVRTMNYLGQVKKKLNGRSYKLADFKKVVITMDQDFVFPDPPDPKTDGAIEIPPQASVGRGSGKLIRKKIEEYNARRGYEPPETSQ